MARPSGQGDGDALLYALVPCAGVGTRAETGGPKQYASVLGRPVVAHTLDALAGVSRLNRVLVVLSPDDDDFERHVPSFDGWVARCGGATRADSVRAGLDELVRRGASAFDWVLVHDAARCLLRPVWVDALIDACVADDAQASTRRGEPVGGLLALPVADTLKSQATDFGSPHAASDLGTEARRTAPSVAHTVDRTGLWQAQTPQMFRIGALRDALVLAAERGVVVTDEASAIEAAGAAPLLVRGDIENFKLTYPADFALAERLLRTR